MSRLPVLSIITWAPFVSALVIMAFARHRPLLVRLTSVLGSGVSLACSLWLYGAYDQAAAGFQFVTVSSDARLMAAGAQEVMATMRAGLKPPGMAGDSY